VDVGLLDVGRRARRQIAVVNGLVGREECFRQLVRHDFTRLSLGALDVGKDGRRQFLN
jgi:hypothetical protein